MSNRMIPVETLTKGDVYSHTWEALNVVDLSKRMDLNGVDKNAVAGGWSIMVYSQHTLDGGQTPRYFKPGTIVEVQG